MKKIIDDFVMAMQLNSYEKPISIEIGERFAEALNTELRMMLKYASNSGMAHNECLYNGVLLIAPKNFAFRRDIPSMEDFR